MALDMVFGTKEVFNIYGGDDNDDDGVRVLYFLK